MGRAPVDICQSTERFERWLRRQLGGDVVARDIRKKHRKMARNAFRFLRATYYRWAETILDICPELGDAPSVLAVGDIHIENFGTWRDEEGRLVWGVNDFDDAAEMPYVLDLVRLAASAVLARQEGIKVSDPCGRILAGYGKGLRRPRPIVLERDHPWLHKRLEMDEGRRKKFWRRKFDPGSKRLKSPPPEYVLSIDADLPDLMAGASSFWRRQAGSGSLGRPRWVGYGLWRGAPVVREAKAMVPSGWTLAQGGDEGPRSEEIATGLYRAPDPWYHVTGSILVRRRSPNNRKLNLGKKKNPYHPANGWVLKLMGRDLAAVHLGAVDRAQAIAGDLDRRSGENPAWLDDAVAKVVEAVKREQKIWARSEKARAAKAKKLRVQVGIAA